MIRAFRNAPSGLISLAVIAAIVAVAILAPILIGTQAAHVDVLVANEGPSGAHLLGTDALGRDVLERTLVATQLSIVLAVVATGLAAIIGLFIGGVASVLPTPLRGWAMRALDVLIAFPPILVAVFLSAIIGPGWKGALFGVA